MSHRLPGVALCLCMGLAMGHPCTADDTVFPVGEFGALGDGVTDDGPAIRAALAAVIACDGPVTVSFEKKTYRFGEYDERWCTLPLVGAKDVTLDGHGATLVFHPNNRALLVYKSENVAVRNLVIDYDPLPFTQGDVVRVDRASGTFDVRLHEGYPEPPDQAWMEANGNRWRHGAFLEPDRRIYTTLWVYVDAVLPVADAPRTYRIQAPENQWQVLDHVTPGQRFVLQLFRYSRAWQEQHDVQGTTQQDRGVFLSNRAASIQIRLSKRCVFENIDHYISPGMTFRLTGTEDVRIRNVRITYKPGTDRLTASLADGVHAKNNITGPFIESCLFEGALDDSINLSTMMDLVERKLDDHRFITRYTDIIWYDTPLRPGDELMAWDPVHGRVLGRTRATEVRFIENRRRELTIDRAIPDVVAEDAASTEHATKFYIVKQAGAVVRNCTFRSQMKTAMVFRDPGICENNTIEDCAFGVHAFNSARWGEGPHPHDFTIRNNTFTHIKFGAITMLATSLDPDMAPLGERVLIENNTITQNNGHGVHLTNLRDVTFRNNRITMEPDTPSQYAPVTLVNCSDIAIDGLTVTDPRTSPGVIQAPRTPSTEVDTNNLHLDVPDSVPGFHFQE